MKVAAKTAARGFRSTEAEPPITPTPNFTLVSIGEAAVAGDETGAVFVGVS